MTGLNVDSAAVSVGTAREPAPPAAPRWIAAVLCILYGSAKINGSQFTVLDSELARPMGEVSGFWLTWYYFGYSSVYGTLLSLIQIAAGFLLVVPRTSLAGALLLLPVAVNILLIDIFYGVDLGGTFAAAVLCVCALLTVGLYARRLSAAVLLTTLPGMPSRATLAALACVTAGSFALTWWIANYNNRAPTRIDGVWSVAEHMGAAADRVPWRTVFFERNRAFLVVFRSERHPDVRHHFEVDHEGRIRIWETWLTKGPLVMQGRIQSADRIELERPSGRGRLVLQRKSPQTSTE